MREQSQDHGPLSEPLAVVSADEEGIFRATLEGLEPGDIVSAIATQEKYGTSEPAANAIVLSLNRRVNPFRTAPLEVPNCTTAPAPPPPPPITGTPRNLEADFPLNEAAAPPPAIRLRCSQEHSLCFG